jgi:hypothetical protein
MAPLASQQSMHLLIGIAALRRPPLKWCICSCAVYKNWVGQILAIAATQHADPSGKQLAISLRQESIPRNGARIRTHVSKQQILHLKQVCVAEFGQLTCEKYV